MKMNYSLSISGKHYNQMRNHLYPGDQKEAVVIALCGRQQYKNNYKFLVYKMIPIEYKDCEIREPDLVKWSTDIIRLHLIDASKKGLAVVKFHSHPSGYNSFSKTDDKSDKILFDSVYGWMNDEAPHASVIMLPNGELFGRVISSDLEFHDFEKVILVGDEIKSWFKAENIKTKEEFNTRTVQAFGFGTTSTLRKLKAGVVGCSGTGSPTIEQLVRLGIGKIVLVDPDKVEEKNLNRILNSTIKDANEARYKVDVISESIKAIGLNTEVEVFTSNIFDNAEVIDSLTSCDVIFGCVDSIDGRHILNQIATFYLIPYFDIGVKIIADGKGGIDQICGAINYLQPGGSSLKSRAVYTNEELRAAGLFRTNFREYEEQRKSGYIVNVNVNSPAVISINMYASSIAVNEFLARIHSYRYDSNSEFAIVRFSLTDAYLQMANDGEADIYLQKFVGRGNLNPMLNMTELSSVFNICKTDEKN